MMNFVVTLLGCSVSMSLIALVYMFLTPFLTKRYHPKYCYYAWLVVVVGLIIPMRPHFGWIPPWSASLVLNDSADSIHSFDKTAFISVGVSWAVGLMIFLLYHTIRHIRFMKITKRWSRDIDNENVLHIVDELCKELRIKKHKVRVRRCSCVSSPMLTGLVYPVILLPDIDFSSNEIDAILRHELIHLKRYDLLYKCLVLLATAIHWFNPIVYVMARFISRQCEISCDTEVVRECSYFQRCRYSKVLLGTIKIQSKQQTDLCTSFYSEKSNLKNRVLSIMDTTKKKIGIGVIGVLLLIVILAGEIVSVNAHANENNLSETTSEQVEEATINADAVGAFYN